MNANLVPLITSILDEMLNSKKLKTGWKVDYDEKNNPLDFTSEENKMTPGKAAGVVLELKKMLLSENEAFNRNYIYPEKNYDTGEYSVKINAAVFTEEKIYEIKKLASEKMNAQLIVLEAAEENKWKQREEELKNISPAKNRESDKMAWGYMLQWGKIKK